MARAARSAKEGPWPTESQHPTADCFRRIPLKKLRPNRHQPRQHVDAEALKDLATSIAQHGLIQAIAVTETEKGDGGYDLVAGERRRQACELLGMPEIRAVVIDGDPAVLALIENLQRENLRPIEQAQAIRKLMKLRGLTQANVAKVLGESPATVSEILRLLKLPEEIKHEARQASVSKSTLLEISRLNDEREQIAAWKEATEGKLTVQDARKKKAGHPRPPAAPAEVALRKGNAFFDALEAVSPEDKRYAELVDLASRILALLDQARVANR